MKTETKTEYSVTSKWGLLDPYTNLEYAKEYAKALRHSIETGMESGDLEHDGRVMQRTITTTDWEEIK